MHEKQVAAAQTFSATTQAHVDMSGRTLNATLEDV